LEHFFPFSWECHDPNWRTQIFQRGSYTTNQIMFNILLKPKRNRSCIAESSSPQLKIPTYPHLESWHITRWFEGCCVSTGRTEGIAVPKTRWQWPHVGGMGDYLRCFSLQSLDVRTLTCHNMPKIFSPTWCFDVFERFKPFWGCLFRYLDCQIPPSQCMPWEKPEKMKRAMGKKECRACEDGSNYWPTFWDILIWLCVIIYLL
jgi:hypothetical protein